MPNSHFDNVLTLYRFDGELKMCVFSAIQKLEVAMRAKVIYHFSMKHGPFWFMDKELADKPTQFEDNLERLRTEVSRSYEDFIKEHFSNMMSQICHQHGRLLKLHRSAHFQNFTVIVMMPK